MITSASAYLFLKEANVLLSEGKSFPRHGKPNAEYTVVPFKLIPATPVGARINTRGFLGEPSLYCCNIFTYWYIVLIKCDFFTPPKSDMYKLNGFTPLDLIELFCFIFSFAYVET